MTLKVTDIYRHPIKAHGVEALKSVTLTTGKCLPWDRAWAVATEAAKIDFDAPEWAGCGNFTRGAKAPELMAIQAQVNEGAGTVTLTHPRHEPITINPAVPSDARRFIDWTKPLIPANRAAPKQLYHAAGRGLTDSSWPSVSINTQASLNAVEARAGVPLSPLRFRGNIWLAGGEAWQEFDWIGKEIRIGEIRLEVRERIERCLATTANPQTGQRDVEMLNVLESGWGHRDFGIKAFVVQGGKLNVNDPVEIL